MPSLRNIFISLGCLILIITALWMRKSKDLRKDAMRLTISPAVAKTCLHSYNRNEIQKRPFEPSLVKHGAPESINPWVQNKSGFEIGGPSHHTFRKMGFYDAVASLDVTQFASKTLWESELVDGGPFKWNNKQIGKQFIRDAVNLTGIDDASYDFVASSHALEHIANPFKALLEWIRILKPGGFLITITPLKEVTFDHRRNVTQIEHLINDYLNKTTEADLSHLEEILSTHDIVRDPGAKNTDFFKARSLKNYENRGLHQHIFDRELLYYMYICLNLDVKEQITWGNSNLIIGQKKN